MTITFSGLTIKSNYWDDKGNWLISDDELAKMPGEQRESLLAIYARQFNKPDNDVLWSQIDI